jgi:hypothetical protein
MSGGSSAALRRFRREVGSGRAAASAIAPMLRSGGRPVISGSGRAAPSPLSATERSGSPASYTHGPGGGRDSALAWTRRSRLIVFSTSMSESSDSGSVTGFSGSTH